MKEYRIITLGGVGGRICTTLVSQGIDAERIFQFHSDLMAFEYLNIKNKFFVGEKGRAGAVYDYRMADQFFDKHVDLFERVIESDVLYILVCGLGGRTGTELVTKLSALLSKKGKEFVVIATLPFPYEGKHITSKALSAFIELESLAGVNFIPLPMEDIVASDLTFVERFERANQCVTGVIKGVLMKCGPVQRIV